MLPDSHVFTTRAWMNLVVLEYAQAIREETWLFSTFRNSADLLCLDLTK